MPSRELFWNISDHVLMYPLFVVALLICIVGMIRLFRKWKRGSAENRHAPFWKRLSNAIIQSFAQKRILNQRFAGLMHTLLVWAFLTLSLTTLVVFLQSHFGFTVFTGTPYLVFKVLANSAGLVMLMSLTAFLVRRLKRPDYLSHTKDDLWVLLVLIAILVTGFAVQTLRVAVVDDPWIQFAYISWIFMPLLKATFSASVLAVLHAITWWLHFLLAMFFIAWLPFSKLAHIVLGPAAQYFFEDEPKGVPPLIDFEDEEAESFGKSKLTEFSWKTWFDADTCIRCGRCQLNCPAHHSGKHLNPRASIATLKEQIRLDVDALLPGEVISEEDIWACTTCRSCEEQCPMFIEQVNRLTEMRRWLVMTESRFPRELQQLFKNLENNGNAWGIGFNLRQEHYAEMELENHEDPEILLWPGCSGAFDMRNQEVFKAFMRLLKQAGVKYATLGNSEKCCGDPARRLGNEYLFQTLARENIEKIKATGLKRLVTTCPHCLHMLKDEYPALGSDFSIVHHSQYLLELLESARLKLPKKSFEVVFKDSCYLGRYCGEYNAPRQILADAGITVLEAENNREKSVCCGAGGGLMWIEEPQDKRVNEYCLSGLRPRGTPIVTACPYCLTMLHDALSDQGEQREVLDIAELLTREV